jgi:glutamine amidotransferase
MEHLDSRGFSPLVKRSIASGLPFLGICLGMQMLLDSSEEAPGVQGLSVFKGKVKRFPECGEKIPHMGWNSISMPRNVLLKSFRRFVHLFRAFILRVSEDEKVIARNVITSMISQTALSSATSSHAVSPRKGQERGLRLLKNFVEYCEARQTGKGS